MSGEGRVKDERGEKIGAFFDLDGTLLPKPSLEWRFIAYLVARDAITSGHALRWLLHAAKTICRNPRAATSANKSYLAGLRESLVSDWATAQHRNPLDFYPRGVERIRWHLAQQHAVFVVSGTLAPLARTIVKPISPQIEVIATELEVRDSRWTGRLTGEHMSGAAKRRAIQRAEAKCGLRLDLSYAYGNAMADRAMLQSVGRPFAVNPTLRLRHLAAKRNWPILDWAEARKSRAEATNRLAVKEAR